MTHLVAFCCLASALLPACGPDSLLRTGVPDAPVVLLLTLQGRPPDHNSLPVIGASDYARMGVQVHLDEVVRGSFPLAPGEVFVLALHSMALSFGGDYAGEQYLIGLDTDAAGRFALASIRVPADLLFFVRARIQAIATPSAGLRRVDLTADAKHFFTAVIEPGALPPELPAGVPVVLGSYHALVDGPDVTEVCLGLIRRPTPDVRPLRVVRTLIPLAAQ